MFESNIVPDAEMHPQKTYKFQLRSTVYETPNQFITGREVLELAGLVPPEQFKLDLKTHGNHYREIALDELVDLTEPGIEKFVSITRDQYEG